MLESNNVNSIKIKELSLGEIAPLIVNDRVNSKSSTLKYRSNLSWLLLKLA